jgi:hypothetical protein
MKLPILWAAALLALAGPLGSHAASGAAPWKQGEPADESTHHQITLAIAAAKHWWSEHQAGFKGCQVLMPRGDWRKLDSSRFFGDVNSKGVAYSSWNLDGGDYWFAVRNTKDHGPWKISAPQEGGFTLEWTIGVGTDADPAQIVEVRMIYPIDIVMFLPRTYGRL